MSKPFYLSQMPITLFAMDACRAALLHGERSRFPCSFRNMNIEGDARKLFACDEVSWKDMDLFFRWLGPAARLPFESEFVVAMKAWQVCGGRLAGFANSIEHGEVCELDSPTRPRAHCLRPVDMDGPVHWIDFGQEMAEGLKRPVRARNTGFRVAVDAAAMGASNFLLAEA